MFWSYENNIGLFSKYNLGYYYTTEIQVITR